MKSQTRKASEDSILGAQALKQKPNDKWKGVILAQAEHSTHNH